MRSIRLVAMLAALAAPDVAHAFCGFYVAGSNQEMFADATQVVLMRSGTRTVLSMQNNYKGPPEEFALVIPVPVVLHEKDVKTLPKDVFEHVEQMGAPRLVEYWEQDPCNPPRYADMAVGGAMPPPTATAADEGGANKNGVTIEAQFVVGEYQIVILSAKEAAGLETWLHEEKYNIPAGAEPLLRPYVEGGMKFFVAKVDPKKVKFVDGRAELSPIRFHYDADDFSLPIRLGLANSNGKQDLIVNIIAPNQRYDLANYKNVTIPTNLDVKESMKDKFPAFYAALFDRTLEKNPGAIVTEYSWAAMSCDPCPGPTLQPNEIQTLGGDVLSGTTAQPEAYQGYDYVLTRLHARYGKEITNDLVFKKADAIMGGREVIGEGGKLEEGAKPAGMNNFQGRYAVRHPWTKAITCQNPQRGIWGGPWPEVAQQQIATGGAKAATDLAFAPRDQVKLASAVLRDVPEIDLHVDKAAADTAGVPGAKKKSGCGCQTTGGGDVLGAGLLVGLSMLVRRRRR